MTLYKAAMILVGGTASGLVIGGITGLILGAKAADSMQFYTDLGTHQEAA